MSRLLSSARDIAINRAIQPLLSFALVVLLGRVSSSLLGEYVIVTVWFVILQTLPALGLGPYVMREFSVHPEEAGLTIGSMLVLESAVAILLLVGTYAILPAMRYPPDVQRAVLVACICMFPSVVVHVSELFCVSIHNTRPVAVVSLVENVTRVGLCLLAVYLGYGVTALLLSALAGRLGAAAWHLWNIHRRLPGGLRVSFARALALLRKCPVYALNTVVLLVVARADFMFLSVAVSREAIAQYSVAYKFLEFGLLLTAAFGGALFPHLARASHGENWTAVFDPIAVRSTKLLLLATALACFLLYVNADGVLLLFFPRQYPAALDLLRLLVPVLFLASLNSLASAILFSTSRPRSELFALSVSSMAYVGCLAVLIPRFGVRGAAYATAIEAVVELGIRTIAVADHLTPHELRLARLPAAVLATVVLASVAGASNMVTAGPVARLLGSTIAATLFIAYLIRARILRSEELSFLGVLHRVEP